MILFLLFNRQFGGIVFMVLTEKEDPRLFLAIDFLGVFFSMLKLKKKNVISSKQLFETLGKYHNQFKDLFLDIDIRDNCGVFFSSDIEEGIVMLQILGAIGKANPRYEKIILKIDIDSARQMIGECDEYHKKEIENFTDIFLKENY